MKRKLFGTDGIRGPANSYPLTPEMVVKVGKAAALAFKNGKKHPKIIIGKDTRISGYILETALTAGLCAMGADVVLVGPMPTPAVAHITKSMVGDAGIVITASHNPSEDNGIKFFSGKGIKLPDEIENEIERKVLEDPLDTSEYVGDKIGKAYRVDDAIGRYIATAKSTILNYSLSGMKIILDCANGAGYKIAPMVFEELGAEVITMGDMPDGLNINEDCGATHPEQMGQLVREYNADIGFAFDGDADRLIVCDENGEVVDGDRAIYLLAENHKKRNVLKNDTVVVTQYSNLALDANLKKLGIETVRVENGDRYVIDAMLKGRFVVGGEKSGHIILSRYNTTGDGIVSALHVAKIVKKSKKKMSELANFDLYPQVLDSIEVTEKKPLEEIPGFKEAKEEIEKTLGNEGRIFVRYSGTEKKCRVMIEGKNKDQVNEMIKRVNKIIVDDIGA